MGNSPPLVPTSKNKITQYPLVAQMLGPEPFS